MVNKGIKINAGFDTYATAYYSACFYLPWTEWSAKAECIEGHITISQTSIRKPRLTTQPAFTSRGLSDAKGCIEGHNTTIADFDT